MVAGLRLERHRIYYRSRVTERRDAVRTDPTATFSTGRRDALAPARLADPGTSDRHGLALFLSAHFAASFSYNII